MVEEEWGGAGKRGWGERGREEKGGGD